MLRAEGVDLFQNSIALGIQIVFALHHFGDGLACWEKRSFLLEHNALPMFFPIF
jgi:hypothetical protein